MSHKGEDMRVFVMLSSKFQIGAWALSSNRRSHGLLLDDRGAPSGGAFGGGLTL